MAKSKSLAYSRSRSRNNSGSPSIFSLVFGGVLGGFAAIAALGLVCITLFGIGYYLIVTYNKPGTKLFKEIQPMQYVGIVLCILGCLPFIQYFFMGFLANAGGAVFSSMFGE
jgi:hypothetical protein